MQHSIGDESREMLGIMEQLRYNDLNHSPATRTRRSSRMRVKLQLVMCSDEGHAETVTDVITLVTVQVVKTGITPPRALSDRFREAKMAPLPPAGRLHMRR
jgi:hypothetical protein